MTTATALFNYNDHKIRVVDIDGQPWFVAQELCRLLDVNIRPNGTVNTSNALAKLDADQKQLLPYSEAHRMGLQSLASRVHGLAIINESGLYKFLLRSDKPEAKPFQDWVTRIVLPAIRKDGGYIVGEKKLQAALVVALLRARAK